MTVQPDRSANDVNEPDSLEPSDAEIEAWAARERHRRAQWLSGPTPEQAALSVIRERARHETALADTHHTRGSDFVAPRAVQRSLRTAQLAAEGAMSLLFQLSLRDVRDHLTRAGLEWEDEFTLPARTERNEGHSAAPRES